MDEAISTIASSGVLGALLIIVLFAYARKDKEYRDVQEARVTDARKVTTTILEMQEKWQATINALERAVDKLGTKE